MKSIDILEKIVDLSKNIKKYRKKEHLNKEGITKIIKYKKGERKEPAGLNRHICRVFLRPRTAY